MKQIISALIEFQKNVKPIPKNKINPFYSSKYAELSTVIDVCQPYLNDAGLAVIQVMTLQPESNDNILKTLLCHSSGETIESSIYLPKITDAQKLTGAITYLRRTSYLSILGLVADDDLDGNDTVDRPKEIKAPVKEIRIQAKEAPLKIQETQTQSRQISKPSFSLEPKKELSGMATDSQKNYIKRLGIKFDETLTKQEASKIIEDAQKRN